MSTQPTLLTLPPELRLQIYDLILGLSKPVFLSPTSQINTWVSPSLSRTCRILRQETLSIYFGTQDFIYDLSSPLNVGLENLERVLKSLEREGVKLRGLRFKHVNRGISSLDELTAWVRVFVVYRDVLPCPEFVSFCQGPSRYRGFAENVVVVLRRLIGFARGINERLFGSGEESVLGEWIVEVLGRMEEGRVVLRGLRFAEDFVRGFRIAAAGADTLGWSGLSGNNDLAVGVGGVVVS